MRRRVLRARVLVLIGVSGQGCEPVNEVSAASDEIASSLAPGETRHYSVLFQTSGDARSLSGGEAHLFLDAFSPRISSGFLVSFDCEDGQVADANLGGGDLGRDEGWAVVFLNHLSTPFSYGCDLELTSDPENTKDLDLRWTESAYLAFSRKVDVGFSIEVVEVEEQ